jgi:hypothetical protein
LKTFELLPAEKDGKMKLIWTFILCLFLIPGVADSVLAQEEEVFKSLGAVKVLGDAPPSLNLGLGVFDMFDDDDSVAAQVEWRFGDKLGFVGPLAGMIANADGGIFGYVGLYTDLAVGKFVITPHTGFGAYEQGNSNDLGGVFEFYSSLTVAYRLENRSQVGIRFGHISNADLHDKNPGTDLLLLQYRHPF